ncbi:MAG: SAM-dependent chlorinase/fluorinase [Actinobacteria bacterium]|nr:SAM-dependent chlorinase/fluorinase [Actinomycetota bacterium]
MAARYDTVSFLSDYGTADEFVGVVKSVLRSLAPHAAVIDITHEIPPHDVRAGGLCLARACQYLTAGVVLAVVDPGVGTARRALAVEVGGGESVLVGPDNGLLAPAVALVGGATRAVLLTNPDLRLPAAGATFDGRDLFAPAAAHLCNGIPLGDLGEDIDPALLRPGVMPLTRVEGGAVVAEALWVDRFGNVQLNVDPAEVAEFGPRIGVEWGEQSRTGTLAVAYGELSAGEVGLVVDSYGLLSIALDRRSAAEELGLGPGSQVTLRALADDPLVDVAPPVPITLRARTSPSGAG